MNRCAYCLKEGVKLTREHLIPQALDRLFVAGKKEGHYFLEKAPSKFLKGQPVVKDVCVDCNSGPLSSLDAYALQFFQHNGRTTLTKGHSVAVQYSWEELCRWVMKVHFNSARIHSRETELLGPCRSYLLGGAARPRNAELFCFAISDFTPDIPLKIEYSQKGLDSFPIVGDYLRISVLRFASKAKDPKLARAVIYGSLAFVLLMLSRKAPARQMAEFEADFLRTNSGAKKLRRDKDRVSVTAGEFDQMKALKSHLELYERDYRRLERENG